jgi:hypothetical protein
MSDGATLWTKDDLATRWQAPGKTRGARRKWVSRQCARLGLRRVGGMSKALYLPDDVRRKEKPVNA